MKAKKEDRILRELFRQKLEYAEIIPDPSVSSKLMQKLAVREFLRFNPLRFNVYYLGGIIAAGIATLLLFSDSKESQGRKVPSQPYEIINQIPLKQEIENVKVSPDTVIENKRSVEKGKVAIRSRNASAGSKEAVDAKAKVPESGTGEKYALTPGAVNNSLSVKELFPKQSEDNFKLREIGVQDEQLFETSVTEGCAPLKVAFRNNLSGYDSCLWTFGDGGSSAKNDPEWIFDLEGEYRVVLKIFGREGLVSVSSLVISVFPRPSAHFEIPSEKVSIPDEEVRFQNYSVSAVKYLWSFGDGSTSDQFEPVHRYEKYGNYNVALKVYSDKGCTDSLVVSNAFSGSAYYIEFPNAFIPNTGGPSGGVYSSTSDETAWVFHPSYSGVSAYHLKIFSKLGVLIFETNDINVGWDGYFKGQLSNPGVYIWKVRGNFSNGEPFTKMGDLTLLKN
ncbi:MAG: PKD domain-containing protein [Bacteroidales bacterium]|nr:PKD domain-containing protein [Bacteroidales bacterium]